MKMTYPILFLTLFGMYTAVNGQQTYWKAVTPNSLSKNQIPPASKNSKQEKMFHLDENALRAALQTVPKRQSFGAKQKPTYITLPSASGTLVKYSIVALETLHRELAQRYPNLKTYRGVAVKNPLNSIRIAVNKTGFYATIYDHLEGIHIIDETTTASEYMLYAKSALKETAEEKFSCLSQEYDFGGKRSTLSQKKIVNDGRLRTFRTAIATTGEYSQFHIREANQNAGTDTEKKEAVLSAVMTTMMTINELFENEFAVTMQLIPNMDRIIFLDPDTDDLENDDAGVLISDSQRVIDDIIGLDNYDLGHTFSTGAGGLAQIGSPCTDQRAFAVTGISQPIGAEFDLDFVAHELGHQFGANHTQNNDQERVVSTAVEPGSGSTIMGYAGISAPNIQDDSDPYFNAVSIREIWSFLQRVNPGGNCGITITNTNNSAPEIGDMAASYTIPHSTPFSLGVLATDTDNDALTYCWEQQDNDVGPIMPPVSTSTVGPMFRSILPTTTPERYFPPYEQILNGSLQTEWEVVPTVARQLNFTLTVRDNNAAGGQNALKDVQVNVANAGPFAVTSQNESNLSYDKREIVEINWDVANTTGNNINTQRVDILLSYDGGVTFTEELIANTRNDGRERVSIPVSNSSTTCRIKVMPTDNIYFAINTQDFTITDRTVVGQPFTGTIVVSPNPSTDGVFLIDFGKKIAPAQMVDVSIFDLSGKLVFTDEYSDTSDAEVDLSQHAFGLYLIRVIRGNEIFTEKIYSQIP